MKRLACFLLLCAMVFTTAALSEDFDATGYTYDELISIREVIDKRIKELEERAAEAAAATESFKVYIDVTSEDYTFSDKYDVELYLDNDLIATIPNGGEFYQLFELTKGTHAFTFYKKGNHKIYYSKDLNITKDVAFTCDIVHEDKISLKNDVIHFSLSKFYLDLTDKTGMMLSSAKSALTKEGFVNVSYEPLGDIWNTDNWLVTSQSPDPASGLDKHEKIILKCTALEDYLNSKYVRKDAAEITKYCKSLGISCAYRDADSNDKLTSKFEKMSSTEMAGWIVNSVSYGSKSATIYVKKSKVTATKTPALPSAKVPTATPTKAPTATPTKAPTATPTKAPTATPTKAPTATPTKAPTATPTKSEYRDTDTEPLLVLYRSLKNGFTRNNIDTFLKNTPAITLEKEFFYARGSNITLADSHHSTMEIYLSSDGYVLEAIYSDYKGSGNIRFRSDKYRTNYIEPYAQIGFIYSDRICETPQHAINLYFEKSGIKTKQLQQIEENNTNTIWKVGNYITFGKYEQDDDKTNGDDDIEWLILDIQGGKALLISRYCLDQRMFNDEYGNYTWDKCTLRKWLNNDFYYRAFSANEKTMISKSLVHASVQFMSSLDGGTDTYDYLFIPSDEDSNAYSSEIHNKLEGPTKYLENHFYVYDRQGDFHWWLRTPGSNQWQIMHYVSNSYANGIGNYVNDYDTLVRPMMWVRIPTEANNAAKKTTPVNKSGSVKVNAATIIRSEASSSSSQVGYVEIETVYQYTECIGGWYHVILPSGGTGYIYSSRCTEIDATLEND